VGRVKSIKPVMTVAALAVAIGAENWLYRKMCLARWQMRP
jgi:hypothetical protein